MNDSGTKSTSANDSSVGNYTPPSTGGFPGYELAKSAFVSWTEVLQAHGRNWDEYWSKLKDGPYEFKDLMQVLLKSVDINTSALEALSQGFGGAPSPPWQSLAYDSKEVSRIKLQVKLDPGEQPQASALSRLGSAPGAGYESPEVRVYTVKGDARALNVIVDRTRNRAIAPGQYIGFVMRGDSSPKPIAILTVNVTGAEGSNSAPPSAPVKADAESAGPSQEPVKTVKSTATATK